jgi:hypothetical protein
MRQNPHSFSLPTLYSVVIAPFHKQILVFQNCDTLSLTV